MRILFVDDSAQNVLNISKKIKVFNSKFIFDFYYINENPELNILEENKKDFKQLGFQNITPFKLTEYKNLQDHLKKNAQDFDLIIFDRQFEIPEKDKTGVDLLARLIQHRPELKIFYLILTKEARVEGKFFEDQKEKFPWIKIRFYIDNAETGENTLDIELKTNIEYYSNVIFLKDLAYNNYQISQKLFKLNLEIKKTTGDFNNHLQEILSVIDFIDNLLNNIEYKLSSDLKYLEMILYWYHSILDYYILFKKSPNDLLKDYNKNFSEANNIFSIVDEDKKFRLLTDMNQLNSIHKIIGYCEPKSLFKTAKLNLYRNKCIHHIDNFSANYTNIIYANLIVSEIILDSKNIVFSNCSKWVQAQNPKSVKGLTDLNNLINSIQVK